MNSPHHCSCCPISPAWSDPTHNVHCGCKVVKQPTDWIKDAGWFGSLRTVAREGTSAEFDAMLRRLLFEHADSAARAAERALVERVEAAMAPPPGTVPTKFGEPMPWHQGYQKGCDDTQALVRAALRPEAATCICPDDEFLTPSDCALHNKPHAWQQPWFSNGEETGIPDNLRPEAATTHECLAVGCTNMVPLALNDCDDHDPYHDNPPLPDAAAVHPDAEGAAPEPHVSIEWGIERSLPQVRGGEPYIEWNDWQGHDGYRVEYTADSVWGHAGDRPVWQRTRTSWPDVLSEPTRAARGEGEPT